MISTPSRVAVLAALVLAMALGLVTAPDADSVNRRTSGWCGSDRVSDWVCRYKGAVFSQDQPVPKRGQRRVLSGSKITTGPNSEAKLTFGKQANCTVGGSEASQIFTRTGLEGALFTQTMGASSCTMPRTGQPLRLLCGPSEGCPAEVRAKGTLLIKVLGTSTASISTTQVIHKRARLVLCGGYISITAETPGGARATTSASASGNNRFVAILEITVVRKEEGGTSDAEESASVSVVDTPAGPGRCVSSVVQEEQESVY